MLTEHQRLEFDTSSGHLGTPRKALLLINEPKMASLYWPCSYFLPLVQKPPMPNSNFYTSGCFKNSPNEQIFSHSEPSCCVYSAKLYPTTPHQASVALQSFLTRYSGLAVEWHHQTCKPPVTPFPWNSLALLSLPSSLLWTVLCCEGSPHMQTCQSTSQ